MDQDQVGIHRIAHDMLSVEDAYMYDNLEDNIVHFDSQMQVDENAWYGRDESSYIGAEGAPSAGNDAAAVVHHHATFSAALYSDRHDDDQHHHHNGNEGHLNYEYHDVYEQPSDESYSTETYASSEQTVLQQPPPPWWDASPHFPALHLVMIWRDEKWFHLGTEIWARRGAEPALPFVTDFESDRVVSKKDFNVTAADVKQSLAAHQEMFSRAGNGGDGGGKQQRRRKTKPIKAPTSDALSARVRRTTGIASWIIAYLDANAPHHIQDYSTGTETMIFVTFTTEAHLSLLIELISVYAREEVVQERQSFIDTHRYNFQRGDDTTASESIASYDFTDSSATVSYEHTDESDLNANNVPEVKESDVRERTSKWFARLISFPMLQCWRLLSHAQSLPYPSSSDAPFYSVKWWDGIVDLLNLNDKWGSSSASLLGASDDQIGAQQGQRDKKRRGRRGGAAPLLSPEEVAMQRDAAMARFLFRKTRLAYTSRSVPWMMWDASPPVSSLSMAVDTSDAVVTAPDVDITFIEPVESVQNDAVQQPREQQPQQVQQQQREQHMEESHEAPLSANAAMDVTLVHPSSSPSSDAEVVKAMEAVAIDNPATHHQEEATDTSVTSQSTPPPTVAADTNQSSAAMVIDSTVDLSLSSSPTPPPEIRATTAEKKSKKRTPKKDKPLSGPDTVKRKQQRPKSPARPRPPRKKNTSTDGAASARRRVNLSQSAPIDRPVSVVSESDQTPSLSCSSTSVALTHPLSLSTSSLPLTGDAPSETFSQPDVCATKSPPGATTSPVESPQPLLPRHTPATAGLSMGCKAPMACFVAPILTSNGKRMGGGFLFGNRPIVK